jgi:hypothetical protein
MQAAGKALPVTQHQRIELLHKHRKGEFLLFCHSVKWQCSAWLNLTVLIALEYHIGGLTTLFKKIEHRIRYIALSLRQDCE